MKENPSEQDQALDALLGKVKNPPAPDWFEARTLARLRRERECEAQRSWFSFGHVWRYLTLGVASALVAGLLVFSMKDEKASSVEVSQPILSSSVGEQEALFAALDAFDSYTQQAEEWNQEIY
jgi:hypothetical protein